MTVLRRNISICLLLMALGGGFFVYKKLGHKEKESLPLYTPVTWSGFGEEARLDMLIRGLGIESVIDLAFNRLPDMQKLKIGTYLGVCDQVEKARACQAQYGSRQISFAHFRITDDVMPKKDLILAWDALCCLSEQEIRSALLQFKKSGSKFLLMRHYPEVAENITSRMGELRPINWQIAPFFFPEPIIHIIEEGEGGIQHLSLWSFDKL